MENSTTNLKLYSATSGCEKDRKRLYGRVPDGAPDTPFQFSSEYEGSFMGKHLAVKSSPESFELL
jgi:hypothetical protein